MGFLTQYVLQEGKSQTALTHYSGVEGRQNIVRMLENHSQYKYYWEPNQLLAATPESTGHILDMFFTIYISIEKPENQDAGAQIIKKNKHIIPDFLLCILKVSSPLSIC